MRATSLDPSARPLGFAPPSDPNDAALDATAPTAAPGAAAALEALLDALPEGAVPPAPALASSPSGAGGLFDPGLLLLALQSELRATGAAAAELRVQDGAQRGEIAHAQRSEALEKAEKAGRRARRLLRHAPPWVKKLVAGVISAVGAIASVYTGGAAMGLAIAGAALLLASDGIVKGLEAAGVDPKKAALVGMALKITGAVLSLASGTTSAGQAVPDAVAAANTAAQVVDAANQTAEGAQRIAQSVIGEHARSHLLDADEAAVAMDEAEEALAQATSELEDVLLRFARASSRAAEISAAAGDARLAAVQAA